MIDGVAIEVKTTRRRPHKMEDYVPHVVAYLEREGSTHYKKIVSHLSEAMKQDMGDHQVYKALRRIIDSRLAPIQMDPKHKGFFMIFQGDTGTPSVGQSQEPARASIVSPSNGERELSGLKG